MDADQLRREALSLLEQSDGSGGGGNVKSDSFEAPKEGGERDVGDGATAEAHNRRKDLELTYSTSELNEQGEEDTTSNPHMSEFYQSESDEEATNATLDKEPKEEALGGASDESARNARASATERHTTTGQAERANRRPTPEGPDDTSVGRPTADEAKMSLSRHELSASSTLHGTSITTDEESQAASEADMSSSRHESNASSTRPVPLLPSPPRQYRGPRARAHGVLRAIGAPVRLRPTDLHAVRCADGFADAHRQPHRLSVGSSDYFPDVQRAAHHGDRTAAHDVEASVARERFRIAQRQHQPVQGAVLAVLRPGELRQLYRHGAYPALDSWDVLLQYAGASVAQQQALDDECDGVRVVRAHLRRGDEHVGDRDQPAQQSRQERFAQRVHAADQAAVSGPRGQLPGPPRSNAVRDGGIGSDRLRQQRNSGDIPPNIPRRNRLKELYLAQNRIEVIPSSMVMLQKLEVLWLWENALEGTLPSILASMSRLGELLNFMFLAKVVQTAEHAEFVQQACFDLDPGQTYNDRPKLYNKQNACHNSMLTRDSDLGQIIHSRTRNFSPESDDAEVELSRCGWGYFGPDPAGTEVDRAAPKDNPNGAEVSTRL